MKRKYIVILFVVMVCAGLAGAAAAQSNGSNAPDVAVTTTFTYQGQIKRNGVLFNGTCNMRFTLWDAAAAGVQQASYTVPASVSVSEGVFAVEVDFGVQFKGEARWIQTETQCADDVGYQNLPRVAMNPTPYAIGLMPGAQMVGSLSGPVLQVKNNLTGIGVLGESQQGEGVRGVAHNADHAGVVGVNDGGSFGVYGLSTTQSGVVGESTSGVGVFGGSQQGEGVRGVSHNVNHGGVVGVNDTGGIGIYGTTNAAHTFSSGAIVGESTGDSGIGVIGRADVGTGAYGVYGVSAGGYGVVGQSTTGYAGYFIGKVGITGADLAERFAATDDQPIEPGTVIVVDENQPGKIRASDRAYDSKVVGIISGAGGIHTALMLHQDDVLQGDHVVAIAGRVYCKAEANSAPIKPGDLLTTSSVAGHCMKATDRDQAYGAVIGKALTGLDKGEGLVLVLVNLQ